MKNYLIILIIVLASKYANCQVTGLGTATGGITIITSFYYTDDDRFPITNINAGTPGTYDITLDLTPGHAPNSANVNNFVIGDQVLVIQMWGGIIGTHYNATVNSNNSLKCNPSKSNIQLEFIQHFKSNG